MLAFLLLTLTGPALLKVVKALRSPHCFDTLSPLKTQKVSLSYHEAWFATEQPQWPPVIDLTCSKNSITPECFFTINGSHDMFHPLGATSVSNISRLLPSCSGLYLPTSTAAWHIPNSFTGHCLPCQADPSASSPHSPHVELISAAYAD